MYKFYREHSFRFIIAFLLYIPTSGAQINISLQLNNPACGGFSTGSIKAIPLTGADPYSYLWNTGSTVDHLENLPAGTYTVTVTDVNGTTGTASGSLVEPPPLEAQIVVTDCNQLGTMEAAVNGGVLPYYYEWSTGESTPSITKLFPGLYCLTVTDVNSCAFQLCESFGTSMALTVETTNAVCGSGNGGTANVIVVGGVLPLAFEWSNGETNDTIVDLAPGQYEVTVTSDNGCTEVRDGEVEIDTGSYSINFDLSHPGCTGTNFGSITASGNGGVAPYLFIWSTGDTAATVNDLPPGTYYVTATDQYGCLEKDSATLVLTTSIILDMDSTNPSCAGESDGTANCYPTNGVPPYLYLWSNGDSLQSISGLEADTFIVFVIDSLNCLASDSVILVDPPIFLANATSTNVSQCGLNDGTADTDPSGGGSPPYQYKWSTGDSTGTLTGLAVGTYSVTITSSEGCTAADTIVVSGSNSLGLTIDGTDKVCMNTSTGELTAQTSNGTSPFKFLWSNGDSTQSITNLPTGIYTVTVTSNEGCTGTASATIENNPSLTANATVNHVTCFGLSSGSISMSIGGGTFPLDILWENGSNSTIRNNLSTGAYSYTVTDAVVVTLSDTINIDQPDEIDISFNSSGGSCGGNGFTIAIAIGGTMPYTYLWSTGATTSFIDNLTPGNYSVTVTDDNNCFKTASTTINLFPPIDLTISTTNVTCNGSDGTATVNSNGGTSPYTFLWDTGDTTSVITGLDTGSYSVTVTDANDCTNSTTANISPNIPIDLMVTATNTTCNAASDGTVTVIPNNGTPPFTFLWDTGATNSTINGLLPGTYFVTVTDAADCTETGSASVNIGGSLNVVINGSTSICIGETGTISADASGGTANYDYLWSNGQTTQTIANLIPNTYSVTVTDPSGCSGESVITLISGGDFDVNNNLVNVGCFGETTGRIELNVLSAQLPISYFWNNGGTTPINANLAAGDYSVTVSDLSNCSQVHDFTITEPPLLELEVTGTDGSCGDLGSASSTVEGGTMPYSYKWSNGSTNPSLNILLPGNYSLTVTDANGCEAIDATTIDIIPSVSCNITMLQPITTINGDNGELMASVIDGTAPFVFNWSNGQSNPSISNLAAGNYGVTITDAENCITTCSFFLIDGARFGDFVWEDTNENGIQDQGEVGLENILINLDGVDGYGNVVMESTITGPMGNYHFDIVPGNYQLTFNVPPGYLPSPKVQGTDVTLDSDADPISNQTAMITINSGFEDNTIDAGFYVETNCDNVTEAGEICCDQIVCLPGEQPEPINEITSPSGGSGNLEYQWMYDAQGGAFDPNTWIPVANSNTVNLIPPTTETNYFVRLVRRSGCSDFLESNQVEILVNDVLDPLEIIGTDSICINNPTTFSGTDYGLAAVYNWTFEGGTPATASGQDVNAIVWNEPGVKNIELSVDVNGCIQITTSQIIISASPDFCGYELILNGKTTDSMTVILDWLFPEINSVIQTYLVEWAFENEPFSPLGPPDSTEVIGNSNHFFLTHDTPRYGSNSYRVILNDSEGNQLISNIVNLDVDTVIYKGDYNLVHSYPNPFSNKITIDIYDRFEDIPITVELWNTLGQLVLSAELPTDMDSYEIDASDFAHGAYFLFVRYDGKPQKIFKLVK